MMATPEEIFRPSDPSVEQNSLWAPRPSDERNFQNALKIRGRQICVFGETGVGKTSLVGRLLQQMGKSHLQYSCDRTTTATDLFGRALDALKHLRQEALKKKTSVTSKFVGSLYAFFSAETQLQLAQEWEERPWSSSAAKENLIEALIKTGTILIIDDLEKIEDHQSKGVLADCAKALSDRARVNPDARIIFVGIAHDANELLKLDASIKSRLALLGIPTMPQRSLRDLLLEGFLKLGLRCHPAHADRLATLSCGLPKVAHMLGLHVAREAIAAESKEITRQLGFNGILEALHEMRAEFDIDLKRATRCNASSPEWHRNILEIIASSSKDDVGVEELALGLSDTYSKPVRPAQFRNYLSQLKTRDRGSMLVNGQHRGTYKFRSRLMMCYVCMSTVERDEESRTTE